MKDNKFSQSIKIMLGTMVMANLAFFIFIPMMPLYLIEMKADITQLGFFFTASMIMPLVFQIFGGWIGDRLGRFISIIIGTGCGVVGWVLMLIATNWIVLLIGFSIGSISASFVSPSFDAMIAENSTEESRGRIYGFIQTIFNLVIFVGPIISGVAIKYLGWKPLLVLATFLYVLAAIVRYFLFINAKKKQHENSEKMLLSRKRFLDSTGELIKTIVMGSMLTWIFLTDGIKDIGVAMTDNLLPVYLEEILRFDIMKIGILTSLIGLSGMLSSIPGGVISDKIGEKKTIALSFAIIVLSYIAILIGRSFLISILSFVLIGVANGLLGPTMQSIVSKNVEEEKLGITFGLLSTSNGIISLPFPLIGGFLWKIMSPSAPFIVTIALFLMMLPVILLKIKNNEGVDSELYNNQTGEKKALEPHLDECGGTLELDH